MTSPVLNNPTWHEPLMNGWLVQNATFFASVSVCDKPRHIDTAHFCSSIKQKTAAQFHDWAHAKELCSYILASHSWKYSHSTWRMRERVRGKGQWDRWKGQQGMRQMELPFLVDLLYINGGMWQTWDQESLKMCLRSFSESSSNTNHLLPWQTICGFNVLQCRQKITAL